MTSDRNRGNNAEICSENKNVSGWEIGLTEFLFNKGYCRGSRIWKSKEKQDSLSGKTIDSKDSFNGVDNYELQRARNLRKSTGMLDLVPSSILKLKVNPVNNK